MSVILSDGVAIPPVGFGTYPLSGSDAESAVRSALESGYRLIDTAASYGNEPEVGRAIATSGVPREKVSVMTKLRGRDQGFEQTLAAFEESTARLGVDYVDIYLIHWPLPRLDAYADSWRAMIELRDQGRIRSIGVSNFTPRQLDRLRDETGVLPSVNQIELHPHFPQSEQRKADAARDLVTLSWSPLGRGSGILDDPVVAGLAHKYGVTPAQVVLRWHLQLGAVPIVKSATPERQRTNLDIFGFALADDDVAAISGLERGRIGGDPDSYEEF